MVNYMNLIAGMVTFFFGIMLTYGTWDYVNTIIETFDTELALIMRVFALIFYTSITVILPIALTVQSESE